MNEPTKVKLERQLAIFYDKYENPDARILCASAAIAMLRTELALLESQAAEIERMRDRIERLRGLCKSYSGALVDSDYDPKQRDKLDALIGDMEPPA